MNENKECNNKNPPPPCKEGFEERERTLKSGKQEVCCYKQKKKTLKKTPKPKVEKTCNNRNPPPPCKEGYEIKERTLSSGKTEKCCYVAKKKKTLKIKKVSPPKKEKPNKQDSPVFANQKSLMEFDPQTEIRKDSHLKKLLERFPKGVYAANKYDGHRMMYDIHTKVGYSRTGKTSFNIPDNWKQALNVSDMSLDGEIFLPGLPASQVAALRTSTDISDKLWKNVAEYHIFDLPLHKGIFKDRIENYTNIVQKICDEWNRHNPDTKCPFFAVEQTLLTTEEQLKNKFKETMDKPFICQTEIPEIECSVGTSHPAEGLVLSSPDGLYEFKQSDKKVKYKDRQDHECVVIEPHPLKMSLKCYRADCPSPPDPNSSIFYLSTDSKPKEYFKPGEVLKYTCMGFSKGNNNCPNKPKMPKFLDWRSEELSVQKSKVKLLPPPTDGPNEKLAKYFLEVSSGYYQLKNNLKGLAYRKYVGITRRTSIKINLDNYHEIFGKNTSFGKQAKCFLEGNSFKTCVENRLEGLELEEHCIKKDPAVEKAKAEAAKLKAEKAAAAAKAKEEKAKAKAEKEASKKAKEDSKKLQKI